MDIAPILVIGAAALDTKGHSHRPLVPGTSNPGDIRISVGGVGRNIAENLARFGVPVILLSAVGDDDAGRSILAQLADAGVDISYILTSREHHTAAYLAILDGDGTLAVSVDDMAVMSAITPTVLYAHRSLIKKASMVVIDANLSPAAIRSLLKQTRKYNVPVCADSTSTALAHRLKGHLSDLHMVTPNVPEAEVLTGITITNRSQAIAAAKRLVNAGVQIAVITLAELGVVYATSEVSGHIPAIKCDVVDLTGAGDALAAAIVFGLLNDFPIDEAVRLGASAAALTIQCRETVCPTLSLEALYDELVI
jgi:pseudouridine kinase